VGSELAVTPIPCKTDQRASGTSAALARSGCRALGRWSHHHRGEEEVMKTIIKNLFHLITLGATSARWSSPDLVVTVRRRG